MHNPDPYAPNQYTQEGFNTSTLADNPEDGYVSRDGTWGERDVGGPMNSRMAMRDYEVLRQELTDLERGRSKGADDQPGDVGRSNIVRQRTNRSRQSRSLARTGTNASEPEDLGNKDEGDDFQLDEFMREGHFEKRTDGRSAKKVGVIYKG